MNLYVGDRITAINRKPIWYLWTDAVKTLLSDGLVGENITLTVDRRFESLSRLHNLYNNNSKPSLLMHTIHSTENPRWNIFAKLRRQTNSNVVSVPSPTEVPIRISSISGLHSVNLTWNYLPSASVRSHLCSGASVQAAPTLATSSTVGTAATANVPVPAAIVNKNIADNTNSDACGYVRIKEFTDETYNEVREALSSLRQQAANKGQVSTSCELCCVLRCVHNVV